MSDQTRRRVLIDCDPGIGPGLDADDALAILFILGSPELELEGVTTNFGNVHVRRATENALAGATGALDAEHRALIAGLASR